MHLIIAFYKDFGPKAIDSSWGGDKSNDGQNLSNLFSQYPKKNVGWEIYLWRSICMVKVLDVLGSGDGAEYIINVIYYLYLNDIYITYMSMIYNEKNIKLKQIYILRLKI